MSKDLKDFIQANLKKFNVFVPTKRVWKHISLQIQEGTEKKNTSCREEDVKPNSVSPSFE
jgi:hypothetical protein